jgi:hypothetical protein
MVQRSAEASSEATSGKLEFGGAIPPVPYLPKRMKVVSGTPADISILPQAADFQEQCAGPYATV